MSLHRLSSFVLIVLTACGSPDASAPDGPDRVPIPITPHGVFTVRSSFVLGGPPAVASTVLDQLRNATDGPDDPSRYLIDLVVGRLPQGHVRTAASVLAPYVAAYVNVHLASVAPHFIDGTHDLVAGLTGIAQRFGTTERLEIRDGGKSRRTITGLRFEATEISLAEVGVADLGADTELVVRGTALTIRDHTVGVPYAAMLRLGFDRAVIPRVVPGATDLARALRGLVDCPRLGALMAERIGVGSAALYTASCTIALTAAATEIYAQLPRFELAPLSLELAGAGRAVDRDGDGSLDAVESGSWAGTFDGGALASATFEAVRAP